MSRAQKTLDKIRQNPKNVRPEELGTLLLRFGFVNRKSKGSHTIYKIKGYGSLTVPYQKPFLKPHYVKEALRIIDQIIEDENGEIR